MRGPCSAATRTRRRPATPGRTSQRLAIRRARHYLWTMRRRRVWLTHLERYRPRAPRSCAATCSHGPDAVPACPVTGTRRRAVREVRGTAHLPAGVHPPGHPARDGRRVPVPGPGPQSTRSPSPPELADGPRPPAHDLAAGRRRPGRGGHRDLGQTLAGRAAIEMDRGARPPSPRTAKATGRSRLGRVELLIRQQGRLRAGTSRCSVNGLLHLVGMVGAGKSTLRDILTYWYVTQDRAHSGGSPSWSATWQRPSRSSTPSPGSG